MYRIAIFFLLFTIMISCDNEEKTTEKGNQEVSFITLYTHRHYDTDKLIFAEFEKEVGIEVRVIKASADELIQKMESEGEQSPADILITVDAGRLVRAKGKNLLQAVNSDVLTQTIPSHLRDSENYWFGFTKRARVIAYDKNKIKPTDLSMTLEY